MFDFSNSSTNWNYYDNWNELVIGKMKDESAVIAIKEYIGQSMNRTQSKDHRVEIYEINKISLLCFDDKIYIQKNGYKGLVLVY